jgi:hypothetical protein
MHTAKKEAAGIGLGVLKTYALPDQREFLPASGHVAWLA